MESDFPLILILHDPYKKLEAYPDKELESLLNDYTVVRRSIICRETRVTIFETTCLLLDSDSFKLTYTGYNVSIIRILDSKLKSRETEVLITRIQITM